MSMLSYFGKRIESWLSTDVYPDDGSPLRGFRTSGQIRVDEAPTEDTDVIRKMDLTDLISAKFGKGILTLPISALEEYLEPGAAAALLETLSGEYDGQVVELVGPTQNFLYIWKDVTLSASNAPWIVKGLTGTWIAIGPKYFYALDTVGAIMTSSSVLAAGEVTGAALRGYHNPKCEVLDSIPINAATYSTTIPTSKAVIQLAPSESTSLEGSPVFATPEAGTIIYVYNAVNPSTNFTITISDSTGLITKTTVINPGTVQGFLFDGSLWAPIV